VPITVREQLARSSDALVLVDDLGTVVSVTPRAAELLDRDDLLGAHLAQAAEALALPELVSDRRARSTAHVTTTTLADGRMLDVVVLPTDAGFGLFLAPARAGAATSSGYTLLEKVLSSVRDAVLVTIAEPFDDPGPIIVYANEALAHHTGYEVDELLGRTPRILQGPGTDRAELDRLRKALEAWQPCTVELLNYRKDGSEFWVEFDVVPLADAHGWFTHWVSVQRDITARRAAEHEREQERRLVTTILDSLPAQTALLDGLGRIRQVNEAWRQFWQQGSAGPEPDWRTINYLEVSRRAAATATGTDAFDAQRAADGIAAVLNRERELFGLDYECWIGDEPHWFHLQAVPLAEGEGAVVTHLDITGRKVAEAELSYRAYHDALTGLPNRDLLRDMLGQVLERGRERGDLTAVLFLDIDNFKDVNDAYGHSYGDKVIDAVGERLSSLVRGQDMVARLGGDEYVVVVTGLAYHWTPDDFMARLREEVSRPLDLGIASIRPSVSVGVVTSPPHAGDPDAILRDADAAMYLAKRDGRDRWAAFTAEVRDSAMARAVTEERIAEALRADQFELHYQPIVDIGTGRTVGSEALLRLRGLDGSILLPGHFLAAVENGPLAAEVGSWVLRHAVAQQARWLRADPAHRMSINVSPRQIGHGRLPTEVAGLLSEHGVDPSTVTLELTEDVVVEVRGRAKAELEALRALGVHLAIDDFGTGYSALSYLHGFEFDVLKVDRVFVEQAASVDGEPLLVAIAALAEAIGATAVAEGVETRGQLELVRAAGIPYVQGYLLGRPEPAGPTPAAPIMDPRPFDETLPDAPDPTR
jgi:diguanylate cyclase (GGDEF)-like protein/PAS domain S-box-containing protein